MGWLPEYTVTIPWGPLRGPEGVRYLNIITRGDDRRITARRYRAERRLQARIRREWKRGSRRTF